MNRPVSPIIQSAAQNLDQDDDSINLGMYLDLLFDNRWLITIVALVVALLGATYAFMATPVYEANILVQVEDSSSSSKSVLGDLSGAFDMKTGASAEMEILRSRFVITRAVKNQLLYIEAQPKYFPLVGQWIARRNPGLSKPGLLGFGGYDWGAEAIDVSVFNVPTALEGEHFTLLATGNDGYRLKLPGADIDFAGRVGQTVKENTPFGQIELHVDRLEGREGAAFRLVRRSVLATVEKLQQALTIAEKGKQSGIIGVALEGEDRVKTARILNEIGDQYIRQNVDRKSEEAEKSLAFLDKQLPVMKANVEAAEAKYNKLRNSQGTIDLDEEAKTILQQSAQSESKLLELRQHRDELLTRFQETNPVVQAVDSQIRTLKAEIAAVNARIKRMPSIEQDVLRLTRDVKVNTELYTSLLNSAQQLRLVRASKVGNVRVLDVAEPPVKPVRPKRAIVISLSALAGLFIGVIAAFVRKNLFGGIEDPYEIEQMLGMSVSAAIPHSDKQKALYAQMQSNQRKNSVLATEDPTDMAIESLRSFRTSLQFSMLGAKNNMVLISGPTPGVGKSFVSVNFASVLASTGKRVLLVDADLRKGYLQKYFGQQREKGLSELIAGQITLDVALRKAVLPNVDFISTGVLPPHPAELLTHPNFHAFLESVASGYDFVIMDTAPVLAVSDALAVAPHVGAVFNIVRGGVSTIGEIEEAVKRFNQAGSAVTGIVFNDLKPRIGRYGYGSKYGKYRYAAYKY